MTGGINYQPNLAAGTTIPLNSNMPAMNTAPNPMYPQMGQQMPMQMNPMMAPTAGQMGMQPAYNTMMQPSAYNQQMMLQSQQMRQLNPNNPFGAMTDDEQSKPAQNSLDDLCNGMFKKKS